MQETLKFVSTKTDHGKSQFATKLLQELEPGQIVAWLVVYSEPYTRISGDTSGPFLSLCLAIWRAED